MDSDFFFSQETSTGIATLILYIISYLISISNLKNQHLMFFLNRMEGCYLRFKCIFRIDACEVNFIFLSVAFALELSKREM